MGKYESPRDKVGFGGFLGNYCSNHSGREPFTLQTLQAETGLHEGTCRQYVQRAAREGYLEQVAPPAGERGKGKWWAYVPRDALGPRQQRDRAKEEDVNLLQAYKELDVWPFADDDCTISVYGSTELKRDTFKDPEYLDILEELHDALNRLVELRERDAVHDNPARFAIVIIENPKVKE